jgi:hypothetical protein
MDVLIWLMAANALLTLFVGLYVHRIAVHLQEREGQIGRMMQTLFEKLDSLPDFPEELREPNPFQAILAQIMSQKFEASNIGRSDVGQFTRAEIIPPD